MFGLKTVVVGNMPNTTLAAAITAAKEQDGNKIDHTEIVRVHEWAWLGDWIGQVQAIWDAYCEGDSSSFVELTTSYPTLEVPTDSGTATVPIIAGAEQAETFFLNINAVMDVPPVDRRSCAYVAAQSLIVDSEDDMKLVYGVILTEETYTKENSERMLRELDWWWRTDRDVLFDIRVFVVKKDGSVEMHKL